MNSYRLFFGGIIREKFVERLQHGLYILLLSIAFALSGAHTLRAQQAIKQCVNGKAQFAVSGDTLSSFRYSVTGGTLLSVARSDSVVVKWGLRRGSYRLGVQETSAAGCDGPWVYQEVKLVGIPFYFPKDQRRICPGDTMFLPIDGRLYQSHKTRWSDPEVAARGIVAPGGYRVWVEDVYGCRYTDSITVVPCQPAVSPQNGNLNP